MYNMKWYENLLINPLYLIILLVILILIGIYIVKNVSISENQWRKFDLWCLIFATLGIFCILGDNREFFYSREANIRNHRINTFEWRVNMELDSNLYNHKFNATIFSPENIELVNDDYGAMYSWIQVTKDYILKCVKEKQYIDTLSFKFPSFKTGNQTFLPQEIEEIKYVISQYNDVLNEYYYYMKGTDKDWIELIYEIFAPIFLVISLSYKFVRWYWEGNNKLANKRE